MSDTPDKTLSDETYRKLMDHVLGIGDMAHQEAITNYAFDSAELPAFIHGASWACLQIARFIIGLDDEAPF